jgi:soluble lytic murein transglycosylase
VIAIGQPDGVGADLPVVSIRFGAAYLVEQLGTLDGSIQGALAAYNGGLGNVYRWADEAPLDDPDLFVERIDFPETRNYVKLVYGFYHTYRALYQAP